MFGLAWTEIGLIGVVAMILIGPKDMPVAIKAVSDMVKKARRMAGEFQGHVDDMLRDSNLSEVRDSIAEIRGMGMDIGSTITRAVDGDGAIRSAFAEDPFRAAAVSPALDQVTAHTLGENATPAEGFVAFAPALVEKVEAARVEAPAFIPPSAVPPPPVPSPAFIPPEAARAATAQRA
jgi:sec-independent protein translocase protein TatB